LREVKQYQKSTDLLIRKLRFQRTVREIIADITLTSIRWQSSALLALQETAKAYLVAMFEKANKAPISLPSPSLAGTSIRLSRSVIGTRVYQSLPLVFASGAGRGWLEMMPK
ncbi:hypothetical protein DFJ77DRAFT_531671, partial [Powellomyces hirtus]